MMNSHNLKSNCMSPQEKQQAIRELKGSYTSVDIILKVEEIRNRACKSKLS